MNAFTKILSLLMVAVMIVCVLAGCKPKEEEKEGTHTHTFSEEWSYDATNHWHAATCGHNDEKTDVGTHVEGFDNICDFCDYDVSSSKSPVAPDKTYKVEVVDASGNPVSGVDVVVVITGKGTTTVKTSDNRGLVTFELPEGEYSAALADALDKTYQFVDRKVVITVE